MVINEINLTAFLPFFLQASCQHFVPLTQTTLLFFRSKWIGGARETALSLQGASMAGNTMFICCLNFLLRFHRRMAHGDQCYGRWISGCTLVCLKSNLLWMANGSLTTGVKQSIDTWDTTIFSMLNFKFSVTGLVALDASSESNSLHLW